MNALIKRRRAMSGVAAMVAASAPATAAPEPLTSAFLQFNDVYRHGPDGKFGGLAHMATLMAQERAAARGPVFQTFGGDVLSPSLASSVTILGQPLGRLGAPLDSRTCVVHPGGAALGPGWS